MDWVRYGGYEVAFSLRDVAGPAVGIIPQCIEFLGARETPKYELPFGQWQSEGGPWLSLYEMLAERFPLHLVKGLQGDWRQRTEKEFFSVDLKFIRQKIGAKYVIAEISFGDPPTIENVYDKTKKLSEEKKELLIKAYGEKSSLVVVI